MFPADDTGPEAAGRGGRSEDQPGSPESVLRLLGRGAGGPPGTVRLQWIHGVPRPCCFTCLLPPPPHHLHIPPCHGQAGTSKGFSNHRAQNTTAGPACPQPPFPSISVGGDLGTAPAWGLPLDPRFLCHVCSPNPPASPVGSTIKTDPTPATFLQRHGTSQSPCPLRSG